MIAYLVRVFGVHLVCIEKVFELYFTMLVGFASSHRRGGRGGESSWVHKGRQIHVLSKYMYLVVYLKVGRIQVFVAFCI